MADHLTTISSFIFFSPYLFKLISFISPLFFTTSLLLLISAVATTFPPSKLSFIQSLVDKLQSKLNAVDQDNEDDEFREFEDFEIYKIVFHDPPLLIVGDPEDQDELALDEHRRLDRLFEELDRFEGSTMADEMNEIESRSQVGEFQKLGTISDENSLSVTSCSWRSESSSSFGSCGSMGDETTSFELKEDETRSFVGKVVGELQKLEPVRSTAAIELKKTETTSHKVVGELQKPVKSNATAAIEPIEVKNIKTTSHVRKVLQKLEPPAILVSGEDQKTVRSNSMAAIEAQDSKTTSHVRKALHKSLSAEDQKTVKSNSTAAIEAQDSKTTSHVRKVLQKSVSSEDQKTVTSNSTAAIEAQDSKTTSHVRNILQKLELPAASLSGDDHKSGQNSFSRSNSWRLDSSSSFGSYGSMRKEKEWKRTLACKLFEERNNSSQGEEGMDSLWEAYEDDTNSSKKLKNRKDVVSKQSKMMVKNKKNSEFKCFNDGEDDEDEFMSNGQLCCLKALKLSTGKMNLGMGKPNLLKITKAIKGFGWLHHVGSKHGKKN